MKGASSLIGAPGPCDWSDVLTRMQIETGRALLHGQCSKRSTGGMHALAGPTDKERRPGQGCGLPGGGVCRFGGKPSAWRRWLIYEGGTWLVRERELDGGLPFSLMNRRRHDFALTKSYSCYRRVANSLPSARRTPSAAPRGRKQALSQSRYSSRDGMTGLRYDLTSFLHDFCTFGVCAPFASSRSFLASSPTTPKTVAPATVGTGTVISRRTPQRNHPIAPAPPHHKKKLPIACTLSRCVSSIDKATMGL
jgi:hypothetical protein